MLSMDVTLCDFCPTSSRYNPSDGKYQGIRITIHYYRKKVHNKVVLSAKVFNVNVIIKVLECVAFLKSDFSLRGNPTL